MKFNPFDYESLHKFVWQHRSNPAAAAAEEEEEENERQREQREAQEHRREMQSQVAAADVKPETRRRMLECLASNSVDQINTVERLLNREINEAEFNQEFDRVEMEEASWNHIFQTQRAIRRKIQELQWRAESYIEIVPHQKAHFEKILKEIRKLNNLDQRVDRTLKRQLHELTLPNSVGLTGDEVREIYEANPLTGDVKKVIDKYRSRIESPPGTRVLTSRIMASKKEEAGIEKRFSQLTEEADEIIRRNISKVRLLAERKQILKQASRATGITLKEGVEIEFNDPEILAVSDRTNTVKISRIEFDEVVVRDSNGKVISKENGIPYIHLSNGAVLPLGRFKKWIDAADGVEKTHSLDDVAKSIELSQYGIKIHEGMALSYPRKKRNKEGNLESILKTVYITEIKDGRIYLNEDVPFRPGIENFVPDDERRSLTFGEFVKWWHRYDVMKAISLSELRELLEKYNELENQEFGLEADENPPISLAKGECLSYPDGSGATFAIDEIDDRGISVGGGVGRKSLPEFFNWAKTNHVQKASPKEQTAQEKKIEESIKSFKQSQEEQQAMLREFGQARDAEIKHEQNVHEASTPLKALKNLWWKTTFLSFKDLWNVALEIIEFVKRKHDRRSKGRYGDVGSRLPWILGTEFERVKQAAENDEVNKYKEAMEHWGIPQVQYTLHSTHDKDEAKACIMTLVHKGEMRWDDHEFWNTLNYLTSRYTLKGAELHIPHIIPFGKSGEDMAIKAMDALWGGGTGAEWFGENTSKYNSQKNSFEFKFKQLENDPKGTGGPAGECARLLSEWRKGNYVNPQEYEEMIDGAIKYGKMTAEDKMFFIIVGVLARKGNDPHGETLLHMDRMGELDSKYLNQFPMLDFFTQTLVTDYSIWDPDKQAYGKKRKLLLKDYEKWKNEYFPDDFARGKPGSQFSRFMWEVMMMSDTTRTRISKGIRNAENMDHDDAHLIISAVTPSEIDSICTGPSGQKKYFTNEGYMNAYPGFNHLVLSLSYALEEEKDEEAKQYKLDALRDSINSFIRYDAILDNRLKKDRGTEYARLDQRHYDRQTVVDKTCFLKDHQKQMRNLIVAIGDKYGQDWRWVYDTPRTGSMNIEAEKQKQRAYEARIDQLKEDIVTFMREDNGAKALEAIREARSRDKDSANGLRGMQGSKRPEASEIERMRRRAAEIEIESLHAGGHGGH